MNYALLTLLTNILTLFVLVISVFIIFKQIRKEHEWNRRHAAQELTNELGRGDLAKTRLALSKLADWYNPKHTFNDIASEEKTPEFLHHLKTYLNFYESLALGVKHKIYDNDIAYEYFGSIVPDLHRWSEPFIKSFRTKASDLSIYIELSKLSKDWEALNKKLSESLENAATSDGKQKL